MKKSLKITALIAVALIIVTACAQAPEPSKLNVPSWLVGTWANEAGIKVEATSTNIRVTVDGKTTDLLDYKNKGNVIEKFVDDNCYVLESVDDGFEFEKISENVINFVKIVDGNRSEKQLGRKID